MRSFTFVNVINGLNSELDINFVSVLCGNSTVLDDG